MTRRKKQIIHFEDYQLDLPIVKFRIGGEERLALIDTGCEDSLFDAPLKKYATVTEKANVNLIGFAGEEGMNAISSFDISFADSFTEYSILAYVYDMSSISSHVSGRLGKDIEISAFFGSSFLNRYKADIDYNAKTLILK